MSEREELVEPWYVTEIKSLQERLSTKLRPAEHSALCIAIAALSAQPQKEPVAWEWKCVYDMGKWSVVRVTDGFKLWGPIEQFEATLLINKLHSLAPLYTAPPSGVREGMLRAAEIAGNIKVERASILHKRKKAECAEQAFDTGWAIEEAITRAAEQVNAEGQPTDGRASMQAELGAALGSALSHYKSGDMQACAASLVRIVDLFRDAAKEPRK